MPVEPKKPKLQFKKLTCSDGSRPSVLLAEDSDAARILTAALLRHIGCDVDTAEHGEEAVSHFANGKNYDIVILDIEMPVMDGVVAAREIRNLAGGSSDTPIIALSAFLADKNHKDFWQENFDIALPKPASKQALHKTIDKVLRMQIDRTSEPINDNYVEETSSDELISKDGLLSVRQQINETVWCSLTDTAIAELRQSADLLRISAAKKDNGETAIYAHKLKGIALSFAAPKLAGLARSLERLAKLCADEPVESALVETVLECTSETIAVLSANNQYKAG